MDDALYAQLYEAEAHHWWCVARRRIIRRLLAAYRVPGRVGSVGSVGSRPRLCELGCGTGFTLAELAADYEVSGLDASPVAVEFCARRGLKVLRGSLPDDVPFAPGSCDAVILDVLEHIAADVPAAAAAARLVAPGGVLLATAPACPWLFTARDRRYGHYRRYTRPAFARLFQLPGFTLRRLTYFNSLLFPLACAFRLAPARWTRLSEIPDLSLPPRPINALFRWLFAAEAGWLRHASFPIGLSVLCLATRD